jgi:hypothetical protein
MDTQTMADEEVKIKRSGGRRKNVKTLDCLPLIQSEIS